MDSTNQTQFSSPTQEFNTQCEKLSLKKLNSGENNTSDNAAYLEGQ